MAETQPPKNSQRKRACQKDNVLPRCTVMGPRQRQVSLTYDRHPDPRSDLVATAQECWDL